MRSNVTKNQIRAHRGQTPSSFHAPTLARRTATGFLLQKCLLKVIMSSVGMVCEET